MRRVSQAKWTDAATKGGRTFVEIVEAWDKKWKYE